MVFNRMKGTISKKMTFDKEFDTFIHPSTYVNKLLFSGPGVKAELWNIMS